MAVKSTLGKVSHQPAPPASKNKDLIQFGDI
jgi:hypothetical protein